MFRRIDNPRARLKCKIAQLSGPILGLRATGLIVSNLFRDLVHEREDVTGTAGELPAWRLQGFPDRTIRLVDVLDDRQLDALLGDVNPRTVFNCIAYGAYPFEVDDQRIYDTNFRFL